MNQLIITADREEYCVKVVELSKSVEGSIELIGSQVKADGSDYLETFALRCHVLSNSKLNGIVGVHVTISEPPYINCRKEEILKVSGELQVRNHKMEEFSQNLVALLNGSLNEVVLKGDLDDI